MEIAIAAYGWQGSEWDAFYPEDLPADWRLDYYANEFFAVVVPHLAWASLEDEALREWQDEVADDFLFFWELPAGDEAGAARLQSLRGEAPFAAHWGGVVELSHAPLPCGDDELTLLQLSENLALRPLREAIEGAMAAGARRLLVVVQGGAWASLRPARDLALLLC